MSLQSIFFAYEGSHPENSDAIKTGIAEFNQHQHKFHAKTWEEMEVSGKIINKCITDEIDKCAIFACDLTYLNHNVLFELGYAIGKKKDLLILLNDSIEGSKTRYSNFKILKNVGYEVFTNFKNIVGALQKKNTITSVLLESLVNVDISDHNSHDVFYITSSIENQASLNLTDMLKTSSYSIIYDNTSEVEYQTLAWYLKSLIQSKSILIHLLGKDKTNYYQKNAEASLYAGLGCGLGKKVILIAPSPFSAPIDYTDILIEYFDATDCTAKSIEWLKSNIEKPLFDVLPSVEVSDKTQDKKLNLLKLGVGYATAEDERSDLLNYFIEVDAYVKAKERNQSIFVGRKGTGKSAIFIKLESELDNDANNYNIILKPDTEELLEHVELSDLYKSERSKKSFFYTVWKYIFFSKLFLNIYNKAELNTGLLDTALQDRYINFYTKNHKVLELNFFGAINQINSMFGDRKLVEDPSVLEIFYSNIMTELQELVKIFFSDQKYITLSILADNLDKTWDANHDLSIQSEMILSLLEYSEKMEQEITGKKGVKPKISSIIFLRKDIFDFIKKMAREPDKLTIQSYEIEWSNNPNILKKLIEKRYEFILGISHDEVDKVWKEYFSFGKKEPFELIKEIIVLRPRDIIYFISKLFESAVNSDKEIIGNDDMLYAIDAYTIYLHNNLIAEMKAEYHDIEDILAKLQQKYGDNIEYSNFTEIVKSFGYANEGIDKLLQSLLEKGYLIAVNSRSKEIINDIVRIKELYSEKRFWFLKKNNILLIPHPEEYSVRYNKQRFIS